MGWSEIRRWMSQPLGLTTPSPSSSGDCDLAQRCAILLRPQIANAVESVDLHRLFAMLSKEMAMISGGSLSTSTSQAYGNIDIGEDVQWSVDVAPLLIDRCAVSNERYQKFVDDCGYDTDTWWREAALPLRPKWVIEAARGHLKTGVMEVLPSTNCNIQWLGFVGTRRRHTLNGLVSDCRPRRSGCGLPWPVKRPGLDIRGVPSGATITPTPGMLAMDVRCLSANSHHITVRTGLTSL